MKVPFLSLKRVNEPFEKDFKQAYQNFMESGWYILGEKVSTFEKEFATFNKVKHTIGVDHKVIVGVTSLSKKYWLG